MSKVIPVFKRGDRGDDNNYCPISLVPVFSKILEKVMYIQIIVFLESTNLLINRHFGFRENRSTVDT